MGCLAFVMPGSLAGLACSGILCRNGQPDVCPACLQVSDCQIGSRLWWPLQQHAVAEWNGVSSSGVLAALLPYRRVSHFRLAITVLLRLQPGSLVLLAPVCSSFSDCCHSQAQRSVVLPLGDARFDWVTVGNLLANRTLACLFFSVRHVYVSLQLCINILTCLPVSRTILLCQLAGALGHSWLVERPSSAKMALLPRWQEFFSEAWVA